MTCPQPTDGLKEWIVWFKFLQVLCTVYHTSLESVLIPSARWLRSRGLRGDVGQCPLDSLGDWGWGGQMVSLGDEPLLARGVNCIDDLALWRCVAAGTLDADGLGFGSCVQQLSTLLAMDSVFGVKTGNSNEVTVK